MHAQGEVYTEELLKKVSLKFIGMASATDSESDGVESVGSVSEGFPTYF